MGFKLGKEKRQIRDSKNTPIFRKNLDKGVLGEANMDGSISLHSRTTSFVHPVKKENMSFTAPVTDDDLWRYFESQVG